MDKQWYKLIKTESVKQYYHVLSVFLDHEYTQETVYPPRDNIYRALELTPLSDVKVVIVGQDPYHGEGEADGLAFSVRTGKLPPSLRNIYKEIELEYGSHPETGDLTYLARQGVLLLNAVLTVRKDTPASHRGRGWEEFTDAVLREVSERDKPCVVMLWGKDAQKKKSIFIKNEKILVLEAPHPSPFSARTGFFRCGHFKKANDFLEANGIKPIDWTGEQ